MNSYKVSYYIDGFRSVKEEVLAEDPKGAYQIYQEKHQLNHLVWVERWGRLRTFNDHISDLEASEVDSTQDSREVVVQKAEYDYREVLLKEILKTQKSQRFYLKIIACPAIAFIAWYLFSQLSSLQ